MAFFYTKKVKFNGKNLKFNGKKTQVQHPLNLSFQVQLLNLSFYLDNLLLTCSVIPMKLDLSNKQTNMVSNMVALLCKIVSRRMLLHVLVSQ